MTATFRIERIGAQGDGIAATETGPVYVRFALPGETVTAARERDRAELMAVVERSAQRIEPVCRHFGACGGCALQHLEDSAYQSWKRLKIVDALAGRRVDAPVADLVSCAPHTRRRVVLAARRTEAGIQLGYYAAQTHRIVDIAECPIARPEIAGSLGSLRRLAETLGSPSKPFRMTVTLTASGLDVAIEDFGRLADTDRLKASDFARRTDLARLSVDGEIVVEPRKPVVMFSDIAVEPPPGAFLQATVEAERKMASLVADHLGAAKQAADLFSGCGTFALRLAKRAAVHAVEADAGSLAALDRAYRFGTGLRQVATEQRDLFRRPLTFKELERFDAIVFDPPRAGAEDQAKQIARSSVPRVVAVSCNPVTLARDLALLVDGGYRVIEVTPIDQFLWSPHVEAVAFLEKPRKRR